ncbi:MAG: tetratricopeptide repeat protein, partial [Candidatus Aminicenantes bacterium]|nr:tetratricopeptide repeat protein [Candidatus Aminicenantes bacterium]
ISRYSVLKYKGTVPDLEILGKELDVRVVLTGSIASRENRLVINAELVKVEDSSRIWGDLYNLQMGEIFSVQDEIASVISDNLRLRLTREEKQILTKHSTDNVDAYKLYLQGRFHWNRRTTRDLEQAITYFEQAVAVDPDFALGYASLAETYSVIGTLGLEKPNLVFPKVEEFSLKALSIDENMAEAHAAMGTFKHAYLWDFAGAVEDFKKAIQINPNYATAYQWLAELYATQEKAEQALEQIKKARELDPHSIIIKTVESQVYLLQKKYDKAIETLGPVLDTNPDFYLARLDLLHAYLGKKEYEKALQTTEGVLDPGFEEWAKLRVYAASGDKEQARALFESFVKIAETVYFSPAVHAIAYGDVGEVEEAFRLLDQAYEEKDLTIFSVLSIFPLSPEVRGDPRYMALRKRMGLE